MSLSDREVFGFLKTDVDVHTMGIAVISNVIRACGYRVAIAPSEIAAAATEVKKVNNISRIIRWIGDNGITTLSYSYRLDPEDGKGYFRALYHLLKEYRCLAEDGGPIGTVAFAGLPDTCEKIRQELGDKILYFPGDETLAESLKKYGIPADRYPEAYIGQHAYDKARFEFATKFMESGRFRQVVPPDHQGYATCGTDSDSFADRLAYCVSRRSLPLIRVHAGPYSPNRIEAVNEFKSWVGRLAKSRLLDVLSIGTSQLTQSRFEESWEGLHNGGGVPINSEIEYREIAALARPMLVRTYAGTKNVPWMARLHERALNISWHALSFWWFCESDGRGDNSVTENLREHIETVKYIASTNKPLEPNVPHHFSFRGGDDVTYIVSAFLTAKTAKKYGIRHLILQNMLNTPKYTWGIQDLAKSRAMLRLVRTLEDATFGISLQTRAGLDYFAPDLEKAKVQLAAVTALMDDIEPDNPNSPEIIHVVSYSEAVRLADPAVIEESIRITLGALQEYRRMKALKLTTDTAHDREIDDRTERLYTEAKEAVSILETHLPNLYTPEGLSEVFARGFFPVPYMPDEKKKFPEATSWQTNFIDGGVRVIDDKGNPIDTVTRYRRITDRMEASPANRTSRNEADK